MRRCDQALRIIAEAEIARAFAEFGYCIEAVDAAIQRAVAVVEASRKRPSREDVERITEIVIFVGLR